MKSYSQIKSISHIQTIPTDTSLLSSNKITSPTHAGDTPVTKSINAPGIFLDQKSLIVEPTETDPLSTSNTISTDTFNPLVYVKDAGIEEINSEGNKYADLKKNRINKINNNADNNRINQESHFNQKETPINCSDKHSDNKPIMKPELRA